MQHFDLKETSDRLRHALEHNKLPTALRGAGSQLLAGLQRSAQVIVLGLPESGKTSLINMLLKGAALPQLKSVPILEVTHGSVAKFKIITSSGDNSVRDGFVTQSDIPSGTIRVVQHLPMPELETKRFAEIDLTAPAQMRSKVIDWALHHADIAIWCSQNFDAREGAIWKQVPERLKDNSFLALTKADQLHMQGLLTARSEQFRDHHAEEFFLMTPVATKHGIAACSDGQTSKPDMWQSSGCRVLSDQLERLVSSGKMADADHADLLLSRIDALNTNAEPVALGEVIVRPDVSSGISVQTSSGHAPKPPAEAGPMARSEAIEAALCVLQDCANDLKAKCTERENATYILSHCADTAQALSTLLMDTAPDDPALATLRDDALETEQMIQLFQLERNETAATDAVTVLLQLKKEMSQAVSA